MSASGNVEVVPPSLALRRLVDGFQVSQAIHVVATLGIADLLASGARSNAEIAATVGADLGSLYRVLHALACVGVFREYAEQRFGLTELGECLRSEALEPVGGWAVFVGRPDHWTAWASLLHTVRTGETAFIHIHGRTGWELRAEKPAEGAIFDRAMSELSRRMSQAILAAYDFGRFFTVVDVGGGQGALLAAILRAHPGLQGVLVDLPHVVRLAEPVLQCAEVADRCRVVGGSFFEVIPRGGDAYVLKSVLHDWTDEAVADILRTCRSAMGDDSRLLVVERVLDRSRPDRDAAFSDLEMLVGNGGRERTLDEYRALADLAGLQIQRVLRTSAGPSVIECTPRGLP